MIDSPRRRRPFAAALLATSTLLAALACAGCGGGLESTGASGPVESANLVLRTLWSNDLIGRKMWFEFTGVQRGSVVELATGQVIVSLDDGRVVALDRDTGDELWTFYADEPVTARPVFARGVLLIGSSNGMLYAVSPRDGEVIWEFDTGGAIEAPVAASESTVVVSNALNRVFALQLESGEFIWRAERPKPTDYTMLGHSAPVIRDGVVYVGYSDGQLMAYTLADGQLEWGRDLSRARTRFRDIDATPLIYRDALYVSSFAGGLYRLDPATNEIIWHREIEGASELTVVEDVGYLTTRVGLHAIDIETGEDVWRNLIREDLVTSQPVVGSQHIFVSISSLGVQIVDRQSGIVAATVDPGSGVTTAPWLADGLLYSLSNGGVSYAWAVDDVPVGISPTRPEPVRR